MHPRGVGRLGDSPLGQVKVRALINRGEPTVQFVILQDAGTNLYETLLFILPNK